MKVDVLLFDLGGVLLDYTGHTDLAALLPEPVSVPEVVALGIVKEHHRAGSTPLLLLSAARR